MAVLHRVALACLTVVAVSTCVFEPRRPAFVWSPSPQEPLVVTKEPAFSPEELIEEGRRIFFNETFEGNGRTCATCHPAQNNFTIDPAFIASLPDTDPLFVAELVPELQESFERSDLLRERGLIIENPGGFDDLENEFVLRGVPTLSGLRHTVESREGPRTGAAGDGAPGDGSLRSFATGAVIQHFTRSLDRVAGVDFRLPTDLELDALEAFLLSLGRQEELALPLPLSGSMARRGQEIFLDRSLGKCNRCHVNAGANADFGTGNIGNANFDTGVENLPDQPADMAGAAIPPDDGFGTPGDGTFNTPSLVEAADTGPFFHNNSVDTIEAAVAFYNGDAFNNSPAGRALATRSDGAGIRLDATQVAAVAAFLRVINALENIRQSTSLLEAAAGQTGPPASDLFGRAASETEDAIQVLEGAGLHPSAIQHLREAKMFAEHGEAGHASEALRAARDSLVDH